MVQPPIYLDNHATTRTDPRVVVLRLSPAPSDIAGPVAEADSLAEQVAASLCREAPAAFCVCDGGEVAIVRACPDVRERGSADAATDLAHICSPYR